MIDWWQKRHELRDRLRTSKRNAWLNAHDAIGRKPRLASDESSFFRDLNRQYSSLEVARHPIGLYVMSDLGRSRPIALSYPIVTHLVRKGWAVVLLTSKDVSPIMCGQPSIDELWGSLASRDRQRRYRKTLGYMRDGDDPRSPEIRNNWDIDFDRQVASCDGYDFYGLFFNRIGARLRRYGALDVRPARLEQEIEIQTASADAAYSIFLKLADIQKTLGIPIVITGHEGNYVPSGIFKVMASYLDRPKEISYFEIMPAYQHYFNAGNKNKISAVCGLNLTQHKVHSSSCVPNGYFSDWVAGLSAKERENIVSRAMSYVKQDRTRSASNSDATALGIAEMKAAGKRVIALYGCIPYDFGHPWRDEGYVHSDMREWLRQTCEICQRSDDIVLLMKPHPSEADSANFKRPKVLFFDMASDLIDGDKVRLLDHAAINAFELLTVVDLSIVWRSSVVIEAAAVEAPIVECAPNSSTSDVFDFPRPQSNKHYAELVTGQTAYEGKDALSEKACLFLEYVRTDYPARFDFVSLHWKQRMQGWPVVTDFDTDSTVSSDQHWKTLITREIVQK